MSYYASFDGLIGKPLASIEVAEDKESVTFRMADGEAFVYETDGDCCSFSWIEHVTLPPDVIGQPITEVKESGTVDEFTEGYAEIAVYHTAFVTPKGEIILEYRNSSNGYYGGWLLGPVNR